MLAAASDVDGDVLTVTSVSSIDPNTLVVDNGDGTWTITSSEAGNVSLDFSVSDGTAVVQQNASLTFVNAPEEPEETVTTLQADINNDGYLDTVVVDASGDVQTALSDGNGGYLEAVDHGASTFSSYQYNSIRNVGWPGTYQPSTFSAHEHLTGAGEIFITIENVTDQLLFGLSQFGQGLYFGRSNFMVIDPVFDSLYLDDIVVPVTLEKGDVVSLERTGAGQIHYKLNGTVVHTSAAYESINTPLHFTIETSGEGNAVADMRMVDGTGASLPLTWQLDENSIEETLEGVYTRDVTTELADVNSDGNVDVVFTADDGVQQWARLGDGLGGFAEAVPEDSLPEPLFADVNNDGHVDTILSGADGRVQTVLSDGSEEEESGAVSFLKDDTFEIAQVG